MIHYRIDKRFHVLGAGVQSVSSLWPAADAGGWWTSGGATGCIAAYQPKGAADLAASYTDLSGNGNTATSGTAPSFNAATGWSFTAASTQYVATGVTAANDGYSYIVRFTNAAATSGAVFGMLDSSKRTYILPYQGGSGVAYANHGSAVTVTPDHVSGTLAVTGDDGYRDGSSDSVAIASWGEGTAQVIYIGAMKRSASVTNYFTGEIQAFAMYDNTLTPSQVAAIHTAMTAL